MFKFKNILRGSFFISLLLIISITLSGCDFSAILSGLKNVFGSVISGIGNIIKAGVEVVKNVIKVAKPVVTAVAGAVGEITGKKDNIVSKIDSGLSKVDGALDKVSNVGQQMVDAGNKLKNDKDSAGNTASGTVKVTQTTGSTKKDSDSIASSTASVSKNDSSKNTSNNNNTSNSSSKTLDDLAEQIRKIFGDSAKVEVIGSSTARVVNTSLNTKEENEKIAKDIKAGIDDISKGIDSLIDIYKGKKSDKEDVQKKQKELVSSLEKCKKELDSIKSNPTDKKSIEKYDALKPKLEKLKSELYSVADAAKEIKLTALLAIDTIENKVLEIESSLNKVK